MFRSLLGCILFYSKLLVSDNYSCLNSICKSVCRWSGTKTSIQCHSLLYNGCYEQRLSATRIHQSQTNLLKVSELGVCFLDPNKASVAQTESRDFLWKPTKCLTFRVHWPLKIVTCNKIVNTGIVFYYSKGWKRGIHRRLCTFMSRRPHLYMSIWGEVPARTNRYWFYYRINFVISF